VMIMYLGRIVESGPTQEVLASPNHPYTQALLAATGGLQAARRTPIPATGEMPPPPARPAGCAFHPRCPYVMPRCKEETPTLREAAPGNFVACHLQR